MKLLSQFITNEYIFYITTPIEQVKWEFIEIGPKYVQNNAYSKEFS